VSLSAFFWSIKLSAKKFGVCILTDPITVDVSLTDIVACKMNDPFCKFADISTTDTVPVPPRNVRKKVSADTNEI